MTDEDNATMVLPTGADMTTMTTIPDFADTVNRVGFSKSYDFKFVADLDYSGVMRRGFIGSIEIHESLKDRPRLIPTYLHEVGHLLAARYGLTDTVDETERVPHNRYFAALVATMYRRAGCLRAFHLYELGDTPENTNELYGDLDDQLAFARFRYALERSARLAPLRFQMEDIAALIAREVEADWLKVAGSR